MPALKPEHSSVISASLADVCVGTGLRSSAHALSPSLSLASAPSHSEITITRLKESIKILLTDKQSTNC